MDKEKIKKNAILFGVIVFLFFVLWGIFYLSFWIKVDSYFNSAKYVIENSPLCKEFKTLKINKNSFLHSKNSNFSNILFRGMLDKKDYTLVFTLLTGKYGNYQGLFLISSEKPPLFCGLAGNIDLNKNIQYYGIKEIQIQLKISQLRKIYQLN